MYLQLGVVFVTLFQIIITEKCVTPNQEEAECVPISSCEILFDALFKAESESIEFVRKSKCEGRESDRMVCCGSTSQFLAPTIKKNADKDKLLPDRTYCGYQHSDDYFRNETAIGINEFPWLAGIQYEINNEILIRCSGSLISNRYVLTGANCINKYVNLVGVLLGEYNIKTARDCTEDSGFYECSDPPQNIGIEKKISHPQFNASLFEHFHDIGLLRLNKRVQYSDYIRPICLPTAGTKFAKPGDTMLTSGWGAKNINGEPTETKKKISNKLITNEECKASVGCLDGQCITENLLCTKELDDNKKSFCIVDIGGPVIFSFRNQWHQEGVSTFGIGCCFGLCDGIYNQYPKDCCYSTTVYVKVVNHLDWIKENIEP